MLKKIACAMLMTGLLIVSFGTFGDTGIPDRPEGLDYTSCGTMVESNSPYPEHSDALVYGMRIAKADSSSSYPDQPEGLDYEMRVAKTESNSPYPDQSDAPVYGMRIEGQLREPLPDGIGCRQ